MKKRFGVISLLVVCLTFVSYVYLKDDKIEEKNEDNYLKTVVFKDGDNDLIPILINFHSQVELEKEIRNRLELMKSKELSSYGLYPVFHEDLELLSIDLKNNILTLNFNDELYTNRDDMKVIETLAYTMTDYEEVNTLQLQINGKNVSYLPNSLIPLSSLTQDLGLNNFEETTYLLHQTIPVMAYQVKSFHQYSYYVPTTIRIDENASLKEQVQTILSYVNSKIHLMDTTLKDGVLTIDLQSNILLDNESIDKSLEDLIVLSLCTLENVEDVKIQIDGDDIRSQQSSKIQYNYIKI